MSSVSESPYRESGLGTGEPLVCLFCGWERDANADHCVKCGVSCVSPSADDGAASSFACPRCGNFLALASFGRATIKSCEKCHGVFLPAIQFSIIVTDYLNGVELPLGVAMLPLPPSKQIDRLPILKCIACNKDMDRVNFASRSDAIIDVCMMHGIWLDPPELVPMLHFVKTRAELGEVPMTDAERETEAQLRVEAQDSAKRQARISRRANSILESMRQHGHPRWTFMDENKNPNDDPYEDM
jgi:Zn-finger nucleic acid-binding protein